ncbi:MAG TPA: SPOR domain-containing protein, partial [Gammaproteobacteria bacterium]|nr:SPOR domain-containing protein [Gammaproteobacteria bacterium]
AGAYLYTSGIDTRLGVLETITINQTNELAEIRSRIFSSSLQEGRYASLNARLQALTDAFGTIESKLDTVISGKPVQTGSMTAKTEAAGQGYRGTETPISISSENPAVKSTTASTPDSSLPVGKPAEGSTPTVKPESALSLMAPATTQGELPKSGDTGTESATAAASPGTTGSQPANRTEPSQTKLNGIPEENPDTGNKVDKPALMAGSGAGPWVINLLSSRKKQDTDRLAGIAAGNGIPVVQNRAIVQGKEYWRLQITGFRNATEAKNYALPVKQKLGIKDVWIFRQKN